MLAIFINFHYQVCTSTQDLTMVPVKPWNLFSYLLNKLSTVKFPTLDRHRVSSFMDDISSCSPRKLFQRFFFLFAFVGKIQLIFDGDTWGRRLKRLLTNDGAENIWQTFFRWNFFLNYFYNGNVKKVLNVGDAGEVWHSMRVVLKFPIRTFRNVEQKVGKETLLR